MDRSSIEERVKEVMAGMFDIAETEIGASSSIETVENWDSLRHVNLIMALEQEFGVTMDTEDAIEMTSFTAVCDALGRYVAA